MASPDVIISTWWRFLEQGSAIHLLQDRFQGHFDASFDPDLAADEADDDGYSYTGERSADGSKEGKGILVSQTDDSEFHGFFFKDKLVGNAVRRSKSGETELFFCKSGARHGLSKTLAKNGKDLIEFGTFTNGRKSGFWWRKVEGGGYFVQNFSHTPATIFLYPDLVTALKCDVIKDNQMNEPGDYYKVVGIEECKGVISPVLKKEVTEGFRLNEGGICPYPTVRDPYESKQVEVRDSLIPDAGQGLFSKTFIPSGRVVAYFNGVMKKKVQTSPESCEYSIAMSDEYILDIPTDARSVDKYCATLAHKICHAFDNNAEYAFAVHPRFGRIRSAVALRDIRPGEEITCNYKYSWSKAPEWYKTDLERYLSRLGVPQEQMSVWTASLEQTGCRRLRDA